MLLIGQGAQCSVYQGMYKGQQVTYIIQHKKQSIKNRIDIHKQLVNIKGVVQLISKFKINSDMLKSINNHDIDVGSLVLVCEYINGQNFEEYIFKTQQTQSINTFMKLCEIVKQMHSLGVYHFDLKPDNVLITDDGEPHLIDLGSARSNLQDIQTNICLLQNSQRLVDITQHTPMFAPPKYEYYDYYIAESFDAYSLGCIMHLIITGRYVQQPIKRSSLTAKLLVKRHGIIAADFLCGALDPNDITRYTVAQMLQHSLLNTAHPLTQFQIEHNSRIRNKCFQKLQIQRPHSAQYYIKIDDELAKQVYHNFVSKDDIKQQLHKISNYSLNIKKVNKHQLKQFNFKKQQIKKYLIGNENYQLVQYLKDTLLILPYVKYSQSNIETPRFRTTSYLNAIDVNQSTSSSLHLSMNESCIKRRRSSKDASLFQRKSFNKKQNTVLLSFQNQQLFSEIMQNQISYQLTTMQQSSLYNKQFDEMAEQEIRKQDMLFVDESE